MLGVKFVVLVVIFASGCQAYFRPDGWDDEARIRSFVDDGGQFMRQRGQIVVMDPGFDYYGRAPGYTKDLYSGKKYRIDYDYGSEFFNNMANTIDDLLQNFNA